MVASAAPARALDQWASSIIGYSSEYGPDGWSASQALGAPNVPSYSDDPGAWAPGPSDGTVEFISVRFDKPVYATGATIRESLGNGFVTQIDAIDLNGNLHTVWSGVDPSLPGSAADFTTTWSRTAYPVAGIKVTVDTNHTPGDWEEIDAIQLHGSQASIWSGRLILQNPSDAAVALLTVASNRVTASASITPALSANWRVVGAEDFDGDGQGDIVVENAATRALAVLIMSGNRVVSSYSLSLPLPANWTIVASGDFDGDGMPELVAQNSVTNQVSLITVSGRSITGSGSLSQVLNAGWQVVGAADFNGDGLPDLVVQNVSARQISVLTLNGSLITGSVPIYPVLPAPWSVNAVGDYNGDGLPDLIAFNSSSRQIAVLTVVNMAITSSYSISPLPLSGWAPAGPR